MITAEIVTNEQKGTPPSGSPRVMMSNDNFLSELLDVLDGTIQIAAAVPEDEVEAGERDFGVLGDETGKRLYQLVQHYKYQKFVATQQRFPKVETFADFLKFEPSGRDVKTLGFKEYGKLLLQIECISQRQFLAQQLFLGRVRELFPELIKDQIPNVETRKGWKVVGWK